MIIQNAIKITENYPEEKFLLSRHVHDFNTYAFKDGTTVSVDGGDDYIRRVGNAEKSYGTSWMEWCVDDAEPLDTIKQKLLWGTRGKYGTEPLKYVLLCRCDTEHLQAILQTQLIGPTYSKVINSILDDRNKLIFKQKIQMNNLYGTLGKALTVKKKKAVKKSKK